MNLTLSGTRNWHKLEKFGFSLSVRTGEYTGISRLDSCSCSLESFDVWLTPWLKNSCRYLLLLHPRCSILILNKYSINSLFHFYAAKISYLGSECANTGLLSRLWKFRCSSSLNARKNNEFASWACLMLELTRCSEI